MSRLPEQKLYDWLQRKIGGRVFMERVENRLIKRDTPDLYLQWVGTSGWAELKQLPTFPKRPTTAVHLPKWTTGQRYWALRHATHGGTTWLLLQVGHDLFIVDAAHAARESENWTEADWRRKAVVVDMANAWADGLLDALGRAVV